MIRTIKEFLVMFIILFFVISGLLFGWSAVHGQYEEKAVFHQAPLQKSPLITIINPIALKMPFNISVI